jgi:hypothetical protein
MVVVRTSVGGVETLHPVLDVFIPQVDIMKNNMTPLTKEQLKELGFTVRERELKKGLKIDIQYDGFYGDYVGYYDKYPSFQDIITNVVREVGSERDRIWKNRLMDNLTVIRDTTIYHDM